MSRLGQTMSNVAASSDRDWCKSGEHAPRDITAFKFAPERTLAHFVVKLGNAPGALENSAALATKHRIKVVSGFHSSSSSSGEGFWSFFADFADSDIKPNEFASELEFLPSALEVCFKVPRNGLLVDSFHFPVRLSGERAVIMPTESLASIFTRVVGVFGDGSAARVMLSQMGQAAGKTAMRNLLEQLGPETVKKELESVIGLYSTSGWGIFDLVSSNIDAARADIRVLDNFECVNFKGSSVPRSNFLRGHIAGMFAELVGSRVDVAENKCVAMGDSVCNFVVQASPSDEV